MGLLLQGASVGILATVSMDIWAAIAKYALKLPTADWALVGRWFYHMSRGVFRHRPISEARPVRNEIALGWIGHYVIGTFYGIAYLYIMGVGFSSEPSLISALGFGLATLFAPWLIMQPAMGAGMFARRTARPAVVRLTNISMHAVFGISLYLVWLLLS